MAAVSTASFLNPSAPRERTYGQGWLISPHSAFLGSHRQGWRGAALDLPPLGRGWPLHAVLCPVPTPACRREGALSVFPEVAAVVCSAEKTVSRGLAPRFPSHLSLSPHWLSLINVLPLVQPGTLMGARRPTVCWVAGRGQRTWPGSLSAPSRPGKCVQVAVSPVERRGRGALQGEGTLCWSSWRPPERKRRATGVELAWWGWRAPPGSLSPPASPHCLQWCPVRGVWGTERL